MYSTELVNLVACTLMYDNDTLPEHYELEDAQYNIREWIREGADLPSDLTAKSFCEVANEIINNERSVMQKG